MSTPLPGQLAGRHGAPVHQQQAAVCEPHKVAVLVHICLLYGGLVSCCQQGFPTCIKSAVVSGSALLSTQLPAHPGLISCQPNVRKQLISGASACHIERVMTMLAPSRRGEAHPA